MPDIINLISQYDFMRNAVIAAIFASILCGMTGTLVVIKRIALISGGIAHTVLGGVGLFYYLGWNPYLGAFITSIVAAIIIGLVKLHAGEHEDTLISAMWAIGMASGILFMQLKPGYNRNLMSYLFGNILLVDSFDLIVLGSMTLVVMVVIILLYRQFLAISFDQEFAGLRGLHAEFLYILILCMIALTIVVLTTIVGLILAIALLTLPAAIAALFTKTPGAMMLTAMVFSLLFSLGGLFISYEPGLAPGSTIIIISGIAYFFAIIAKKVVKRFAQQRNINRKAI